MIARAETMGFSRMHASYPDAYRNNDRVVIDDRRLAASVFERIRRHLSPFVDAEGRTWHPVGCNERFRFCRYSGGQSFTMHRDGAFARHAGERSWQTCQIYLNPGDEFTGGETRFYRYRTDSDPVEAITPVSGMAIVFNHTEWHDGAPVPAGTKYVMRTDVMFVTDQGPARALPGHDGYIWSVAPLTEHVLASGGRDGALRLWDTRHSSGLSAIGSWKAPGRTGQSLLSLARSRTRLALGTREGAVFSFDLAGLLSASPADLSRLEPRLHLERAAAATSLMYMTDGRLICAFADGSMTIIGRSLATRVRAHRGFIWAVAAIDERRVVSVGDDGMVMVWAADELSELSKVAIEVPLRAVCVAAGRVMAGDGAGTIHSLSLEGDGLTRHGVAGAHRGAVTSLTAIGDQVISTGEDGHVLLHDGFTTRPIHSHDDFATCAGFMGNQLISGGYDGRLRLSNLRAVGGSRTQNVFI